MDPTVITFEVRSPDLEALVHADRESKFALSAIDNPETWEGALALLESSNAWLDDISRVFRRRAAQFVALLNERANRLIPISQLNHDILRLIFEYIASADRQMRGRERGQWVKLCYVCRLWRNLLHDMPHLWARDIFAVFVGKRGFEEKFLLTRNSSLDLVPPARIRRTAINIPAPLKPSHLLSQFLPLIGRARAFDTAIDSLDDWHSISTALSSAPLPYLEELALEWKAHLPKLELETRIHLANHPKLRLLKTSGYLARPHIGNVITSVDLDLSVYMYKDSVMPSHEDLSGFLISMANLKHLALRCWRPTLDHAPSRLIELLALQTLILTDNSSIESCLHLLRFLRAPAVIQTFVDLGSLSKHEERPEYIVDTAVIPSILDCLETSFAGSPSISQRNHLYIKHTDNHSRRPLARLSIRWSAVYDPGSRTWPWPLEQPAPEFCVRFITNLRDAVEVAGIVSRHVTLSSMPYQPVHVEWQESIIDRLPQGHSYWTDALGPFKHVQSVQIRDTQDSDTLRGPLLALIESESEGSPGPLLGSARRLCLTSKEDWKCLFTLLSFTRDRGQGALLADFIRKRADRGMPIEALEMRLTDAHKANYKYGAIPPEEGESLSPPQKKALIQFAKEVGARAEFVHVEVDDTGDKDLYQAVWETHQYTDVLLTYEAPAL